MPTATMAARNGAAATDAAAAQVTETVPAALRRRARLPATSSPVAPRVGPVVQSAVVMAHELSDGSAAEFEKVDATVDATVDAMVDAMVDAYLRAGGFDLGDPTAWV